VAIVPFNDDDGLEQPAPLSVPGNAPATAPIDDGDVEHVTVTAQQPETFGQDLGDLAKNVGTGLARVPGAIVGVPHMLAHLSDWATAHAINTASAPLDWIGGKSTNLTGADLDQYNPGALITPSSEGIDKYLFKGLSAGSHALGGGDITPYEPKTTLGKVLQAGVTGAAAGLFDPMAAFSGARAITQSAAPIAESAIARMAKAGLASSAADISQQVFPNTPGLAAFVAAITHAAPGTVAPVARAGYRATVAPLISPTAAGQNDAGIPLSTVDNTQPGLANPSSADVDAAKANVASETGNLGNAQDDFSAGGAIRDDLQKGKDAAVAARKVKSDAAYDAFRAQPAAPGSILAPFMQSRRFRAAVKDAYEGSFDRDGSNPLADYWDFNAAGDPVLKPNAAIPP
jgi:hypothetical protein